MCGRYTLAAAIEALRKAFPGIEFPESLAEHYNIAPSQPIGVIASDQPDRLQFFEWGLLPSWVKDATKAPRQINARGESVAEKPYFRTAFRKQRCLVVADGFYEWQKSPDGKTKTPHHIRLRSREPFAFAGLWDRWKGEDQIVTSCAIITTEANEVVAPVHDRMPVILKREAYSHWLDPEFKDTAKLSELLRPYPPELMEAFPVSKAVNSPRHDAPDCIRPAES